MKTLTNLAVNLCVIACAAISFVITGCSDELNHKSNSNENSNRNLTLYIPNVESAFDYTRANGKTRGSVAPSEKEAKINDLYLIAIPQDKNNNDPSASQNSDDIKIFKLTDSGYSSSKTDEGFTKYSVPISDGDYSMYVLANVDPYLDENIYNLSKDEIAELILNFKDSSNGLSLSLEKGLPMACLNTEIKTGESSSSSTIPKNNIVNISENSPTSIFANLTFLCSKVRFTILFDNSEKSFSEAFASDDVDFSSEVKGDNVIAETPIQIVDDNSGENFLEGEINFMLAKVSYPNSDIESEQKYLYGIADETQRNLTPLNEGESWGANKRAWQMIAYLPENIQSDETKKSKITFTKSSGSLKDAYEITLIDKNLSTDNKGIQRGRMYDIVTKLTEPQAELTTDISINVSEWTTEKLFYDITGPFELEVQATTIEVSSTDWATLGYNSDTEVTWEIPEYIEPLEGSPYPFFLIEHIDTDSLEKGEPIYFFTDGMQNHIRIKINPKIRFETLEELKDSNKLSDYQYFYLKAANLYKKITIEIIDL